MNTQETKAACSLCGQGFTASGMGRHLNTCLKKNSSQVVKTGPTKDVFLHLKVSDAVDSGIYWLHVAIQGNATLQDLDQFLRDIWLECCGHMSAFFEGAPFSSQEMPMNKKLFQQLQRGMKLGYVYDFGSSTELAVQVRDRYPGRLHQGPVVLLARNPAPEILCESCGQPATEICEECFNDLCSQCSKEHACEEEMRLPLVNSPRTGVCGYTGPDADSRIWD